MLLPASRIEKTKAILSPGRSGKPHMKPPAPQTLRGQLGQNMAKTDLPAIASSASGALKNAKYEKYCRLRALAYSRTKAYRKVGWETSDDDVMLTAMRVGFSASNPRATH
jgi:hypothetical protein